MVDSDGCLVKNLTKFDCGEIPIHETDMIVWLVLSDEQMNNWLGVEHQPVVFRFCKFSFFDFFFF